MDTTYFDTLVSNGDSLALEAITDYMRAVVDNQDASYWSCGDLVNLVRENSNYGDKAVRDIADEINRDTRTLYVWSRTSQAFTHDQRAKLATWRVSWSHARDAARYDMSSDERMTWLSEVASNGWSVRRADREYKERNGAIKAVRVGEFTAWFDGRSGALYLDFDDGTAQLDNEQEYIVKVYQNTTRVDNHA